MKLFSPLFPALMALSLVAASAARVFAKKRRGAIKKVRQYNPEEWE